MKPERISFSVKLTIFMRVNFFEVTDLAYGGSIVSVRVAPSNSG